MTIWQEVSFTLLSALTVYPILLLKQPASGLWPLTSRNKSHTSVLFDRI